MTAAYLTEIEIIRELHLPERVGRVKMAMWKKEPSFPAPEPGTAGRRYFPAVLDWLRRYHHLDSAVTPADLVSRGKEQFDEWRAQRTARKARKAGRPRNPGTDLPSAPERMASNVVTTERFGRPRVQQADLSPVAPVGTDPTAA